MNEPTITQPPAMYDTRTVGASSILLVDDTLVLRERLSIAMQQRGFRVETAGNFEEAVEVFAARPTELAVLDLRMPGKSGLELLRKLLDIQPAHGSSSSRVLAAFPRPSTPFAPGPSTFSANPPTLTIFCRPSCGANNLRSPTGPSVSPLRRWREMNGNTSIASFRIAVATSAKRRGGWAFTADRFNVSFANAPPKTPPCPTRRKSATRNDQRSMTNVQ